MNELELLRKLADGAGRRPVPHIDVRSGVARTIAAEKPRPKAMSFWPTLVGVSLAAAASLLFAVQTLMEFAEPYADLLFALEGALS